MIKVVLPRTMVVSKIEGENDIVGLDVGTLVDDIINSHCTENMVIYLDDIPEEPNDKKCEYVQSEIQVVKVGDKVDIPEPKKKKRKTNNRKKKETVNEKAWDPGRPLTVDEAYYYYK